MSGEILFIGHRVPFPPDRGDKIRSHHILQRLAELAPVHVATFADDERDMAQEAELASLAASYRLVRRSKPLPVAGLQALAERRPVSLTAFRSRELQQYVSNVMASRPIAAIYVFSGQMGQYVPDDFSGRLVCDLVDVDSAKFDAYAAQHRGPRSWIETREGRLLSAEEARLAQRAQTTLLVSEPEAALFRSRLPAATAGRSTIRVLGNGIDSDHFDPRVVAPEPRLLACPGPRLIFTGQIDYPPNVAAARRLIERIMPLVRRHLPEATLHIVGREPDPELLRHDGRDGCHVWGAVADMRCWLRAADLAVVPLEIARGVQNKVLEAMAMALPVVLTADAATGIAARDGEHFAVAESDEALAQAAVALLQDESRAGAMGASARRFVMTQADWPAALASLPEIVGLGPGSTRHVA